MPSKIQYLGDSSLEQARRAESKYAAGLVIFFHQMGFTTQNGKM